jgi:hypothetical protein
MLELHTCHAHCKAKLYPGRQFSPARAMQQWKAICQQNVRAYISEQIPSMDGSHFDVAHDQIQRCLGNAVQSGT